MGGYLFEGAGEVEVGEGVLLQKLAFDDVGNFEGEFLVLGKRVAAHQLHDLVQLHLLMQDLFYPLPKV